MIQIVVSNNSDTRLEVKTILDDLSMGDNGAIQAFSDPQRVLRYADKIKIDLAFIDYNFEPAGGLCLAEMLRKKHPDIKIIFILYDAEQQPDDSCLKQCLTIHSPVTLGAVQRLCLAEPLVRKPFITGGDNPLPKNIIIVDKDRGSLESLCGLIHENPGLYELHIETFSDPSAALDYAKNNRVDIAFVEMKTHMGCETARRLQDINEKVNIILIADDNRFGAEFYELRASGYVVKPFVWKKIETEFNNLRYPVWD